MGENIEIWKVKKGRDKARERDRDESGKKSGAKKGGRGLEKIPKRPEDVAPGQGSKNWAM